MKYNNHDITDAVGDLILRQKKKRKLDLQIKIVGWLIVVTVALAVFLFFINIAY